MLLSTDEEPERAPVEVRDLSVARRGSARRQIEAGDERRVVVADVPVEIPAANREAHAEHERHAPQSAIRSRSVLREVTSSKAP